MGKMIQAICRKCNTRFSVRQGDGSRVHLLHCVRCGREKAVKIQEFAGHCQESIIGFFNTPEENPAVRQEFLPVDARKYTALIEHKAGLCVCGAPFSMIGKPRCPACRSSAFERDPGSPKTRYY